MTFPIPRIKVWTPGILLSADLNAEIDNVINNLLPINIDDLSTNLAAYQATTDADSTTLPVNLQEEIQRLRYQFQQLMNTLDGTLTEWYDDMPSDATIRTNFGVEIGADVQAWDVNLDQLAALSPVNNYFIVGDGSAWQTENPSIARASMGVVPGTDVQGWDAQLDDLAALAVTDGNFIVGDGANWVAESTSTARTSMGAAASGANTDLSSIKRNSFLLAANTSDASDNSSIQTCGGGAASDLRGAYIDYNGNESGGTGTLALRAGDVAGGHMTFAAASGIAQLTHDGGLTVGSPTGGDKGVGTINATAVYDDNNILTDYVFDKYFDGKVKEEERKFDFELMNIEKTYQYAKSERHLPTIVGRKEWEKNGSKSLGSLVSMLWKTVEVQQLHIQELSDRLKPCEELLCT